MAAQKQFSDELTGILFPEKDKKNEKGPDVTGHTTVGGVKYRTAGWKRTSKSGDPFYSVNFENGDQKATRDSKELTGVLFPVKDKKNEKGPDVTGTATIGGVEYRMAGWKRAGAKGPFYSLSLEIPQAKGATAGKAAPAPVDTDDEDAF
ncbi:hypothetical protein A6M27_17040 [Acidithiobacillus thiooxidans]|uniref:DUF736 domain-containing protein n=1 Tax=Acidithiobacillus thiooxidans TaxID=930 RepID=A0A1C2HWM3_ACITH|nr:hypothetical protein [Acidithiobacillus thiooxidans]OCX68142.1 hypothetical protein A6O24_20075 [Acidithiobacillus thiooxidans]OCX68700.1 hypothetical protein A6P07_17750 [Acidithiobacillus thiooxidans]OCX81038.1 hypothetical protein A6O26_13680 [Acidithiobacillus thiooxidans]OCX83800.1 hypothetical protein A6M27_17040 [Acidithiobacillus thiooxidans]OFC50286.1 hypothetical protein BAE47_03025 [Acidithiobacillus thiooxidans]